MEVTGRGRGALRGAAAAALAVPLAAALAGCGPSIDQFNVVKRDMDTLTRRVDTLEKTSAKDSKRLSEAVDSAESDLKRLDEILKSATKLLAKEGADVGVRVDSIDKDVGALKGTTDETSLALRGLKDDFLATVDRLDKMEKAVRDIGAKVEEVATKPALPEDPEALFGLGKTKLDGGAFNDARDIFREYAKRAPKGPRIEDARFGIADAYLREKEWEKAIRDFKGYLEAYPTGGRADEAWFDIASALYELGDCTRALSFLGKVESDFKKSAFAKKAKDLAKTIKGAGKKKCVG